MANRPARPGTTPCRPCRFSGMLVPGRRPKALTCGPSGRPESTACRRAERRIRLGRAGGREGGMESRRRGGRRPRRPRGRELLPARRPHRRHGGDFHPPPPWRPRGPSSDEPSRPHPQHRSRIGRERRESRDEVSERRRGGGAAARSPELGAVGGERRRSHRSWRSEASGGRRIQRREVESRPTT